MNTMKDDIKEIIDKMRDSENRPNWLQARQAPKLREGMPGTWSHCGNSHDHNPHRHTVTFNEGPYHNILCLGNPGDESISENAIPLGRIVYG